MIAGVNQPGPDKYHLHADVVRQLEAQEAADPGSVRLCPHGLPLTLMGRAVQCPECTREGRTSTPREVYTQDAAGRKRENSPEIE